jgi:hypothetical protein
MIIRNLIKQMRMEFLFLIRMEIELIILQKMGCRGSAWAGARTWVGG